MSQSNKSYRIRTNIGKESDTFLDVHLDQDYDSLEILSLKISDKDTYKLHNSDYGVVVGRVIANGNFGVPNAKISVFIPADEQNEDMKVWNLYPYTSTSTKNDKDIRYNLLPDESVQDCHKAVGTFPHKTLLLENDSYLEVFDNYYIYTTRTNAAGDYLICGVPTGMQTIHMDLDLSDCGILSQRPRDFVYKGYTIEQFDNPNQFKKDENIDGLSQIFSQNQPVYVQPFWGNKDNGEDIGITRADIEISFKFEPTCVFMGSAISDNASNGVGKKCVPTNQMGVMDELTAGEGTIEMIRKTPGGNVEEFAIRGNQLIDGNGVWCYQIPMNLDYMMTDEYGNMVPTDDPEKGLPTRTRVRFRASLTDMDGSSQSFYRARYLIPNNPGVDDRSVDYDFGTYTDEDSYRDLFWNCVYTVKSYIPRFQKSKRWKNERFSGIKACNYYGGNNPMPYNNLRIKLPFMFTVLCIFVKLFIKIVTLINRIIAFSLRATVAGLELLLAPLYTLANALKKLKIKFLKKALDKIESGIMNLFVKKLALHCTYIGDGLCPDMEGWYFAPGCGKRLNDDVSSRLMKNTLAAAMGSGEILEDANRETKDSMDSSDYIDETSTDNQNISDLERESVCLTRDINYLVNCFEMNLAQEYRVIKFDFYNDWVNGVLYFPRWMRKIKRKKKYRFSLKSGISSYYKDKVQGCMNSENSRVKKSRYYTQQCSLEYQSESDKPWTEIKTPVPCYDKRNKKSNSTPSKCHKKQGMQQSSIFGKKAGLVTEQTTILGQYVYYLKPCEWKDGSNGVVRTLLFATDIVLLGTLNDCDENGIPQAFKYLNNSSYIMPTNLALTTMDDDSYIYTTDAGTVCSSTNVSTNKNTKDKIKDTVRRVTPDYQSTNSAYSKTDGDQVDYGENDDPIPVTEAAGISWNYSGPGQDDVSAGKPETPTQLMERLFGKSGGKGNSMKFLYYPGGHFLGLSCVNSDTNIKSCVNLKRICELGATMSQRREEVRGYDDDGNPVYRYYVPTGLISNSDIEGASFRSMFATLNYGKLIATDTDKRTGYKKYGFRFLRADGFDGSLDTYVHQNGSPYNKVVNTDEVRDALVDAAEFFKKMFGDMWEFPDDYDQYETKYTERRTLEDTINDYYMFRFGLDTFKNKEQRKHYLKRNGNKYSMPQYENSFYFYFGLKDGATALDEFKKQFYSECASNNVMRTPSITIKEKIDPETLHGSATLFINNMVPSYTYTIADNTSGTITSQHTTESDVVNFDDYIPEDFTGFTIGHEYTVTVTDYLDETLSKTFVFGASVIKADIELVNFRVKRYDGSGNTISGQTNDPRKGGYIKIGDVVTVLKQEFHISDGDISFAYRIVGDSQWTSFTNDTVYTDEAGETWYLYYMPGVDSYEIGLTYNGNTVPMYAANVQDNTKVNLFISCDYLAYKPEFKEFNQNGSVTYLPCCNNDAGTRGYNELDWYNGGPFTGDTWKDWLMRHSYYRQTPDDTLTYDNYIYTKDNHEIAIFGQPESGTSITDAGLLGGFGRNGISFNSNDYDQFQGYVVDGSYTFIPTMFLNGNKEEDSGIHRKTFDAMSYTNDGRAAADALDIRISGRTNNTDGSVILDFTGTSSDLRDGHGCLVVLENGQVIFPVVSGSQMVAYGSPVYETLPDDEHLTELLGMATVYPTLMVPSMYKPFYGDVSVAIWNIQGLTYSTDDNGNTELVKEYMPLSYKIEGDIYNGLTFNNRFYSGETTESYETYLNFRNNGRFWRGLTANTQDDYQSKRKISFGAGWPDPNHGGDIHNYEFSFGREIVEDKEDIEDPSDITYAITEGIPTGMTSNVYTERYADGDIDQMVLRDSCPIDNIFYDYIQLEVMNEDEGVIYTEDSVDSGDQLELYVTTEELFSSGGFLSVTIRVPLLLSDIIYVYGVYNENAVYDTPGVATEVKITRVLFFLYNYIVEWTMTDKNGVKKTDKVTYEEEPGVDIIDTIIDSLYRIGITLFKSYTLKREYKENISQISEIISDTATTMPITAGTGYQTGTTFTFNDSSGIGIPVYKTLIAKYERPDDGTKNRMTIYKLYPIDVIDRKHPPSIEGVSPYFTVLTESPVQLSSSSQSTAITVDTNINFSGTSSSNWIHMLGTTFAAGTSEVFIDVNENTGSTRTGTVSFKYNQDGLDGSVDIEIEQDGI